MKKALLKSITTPIMAQARYFRCLDQLGMAFWAVELAKQVRSNARRAMADEYADFLSYLESESIRSCYDDENGPSMGW